MINLWISEDIGRGDLTKVIFDNQTVSAYWVTKNDGVFCGGLIIKKLFKTIDPLVHIELLKNDGDEIKKGEKLLNLQGPNSSLVTGERTSLNIAMHLSGIATATSLLVKKLKGSGILLCDTRKTSPGLRVFEKYAIRCGGGVNHRLGLDDAAMIKENHIAWTEGIGPSIKKIRMSSPWTTRIIVEAETATQAIEAAEKGADGILLDEMDLNEIKSLVPKLREIANKSDQRITRNLVIEISGIDPKNVEDYKFSGVDLISTSAPITKSSWIDMSMRFDKKESY